MQLARANMYINMGLRVWNRILLGLANQIETESRKCGRKWRGKTLIESGSCYVKIPQHTKAMMI